MSNVIAFPNKFSVSPEYQKILSHQVIDEKNPGTILYDFEVFLNFAASGECDVTLKTGFLTTKSLSILNENMSLPLKSDLKRPTQNSFPHIDGLYLLARATGMVYIHGADTKKIMVLNESVRKSWLELNPTEQYFTLLETLLLKADPEIIGEHARLLDSPIRNWARFFHEIPDRGLKIGQRQKDHIAYGPGLYFIALLELFGFIAVTHGIPKKGKGWCISRVNRTPFGDAMLELLSDFLIRSEELWLDIADEESDPENSLGELQPLVQPFFLKWQKNLELPVHEFQEGMYVFKVSLGKNVSRRIAIPSDLTLDLMSEEILDAFDFDSDHLYSFIFRNRLGVLMEVNHPYMDDNPPCADEFLVGDLPIQPGESMVFLYDFGDHWEFNVNLEKIDLLKSGKKRPMLLESVGKAPQQYEYSDEEWDEEE